MPLLLHRLLPVRLFEGQWIHALGLAALLPAVAWAAGVGAVRTGTLWGLTGGGWLWVAVGIAVAHQGWVWLCWRLELHGRVLSRLLAGWGFRLFAGGFALLGLSRVASVFLLAGVNRGSLEVSPLLLRGLALPALALALYLFLSVARHFGFRRALGMDHFDPSYRHLPLVREGIFRWTPNAMYVFGFLLLWVPGLWTGSAAALVAAAFNHLYIWVHYLATERPDMARIYGE